MPEVALLAVVVFVAFTVEAALGFGSTVVVLALTSLFLPFERVLPSFIPLNMVMSSALAFRGRQQLDTGWLFRRVAPLVVLGMPLGLLLSGSAPEALMKVGFGAFILVLGMLELLRRREARAPGRLLSAALLMLGGVAQGAFGTGGPVVVYVAGRELAANKAAFRATLGALWVMLNVVLVSAFVARGQLGLEQLAVSGALLPSLALGLAAGEWAHARLRVETFRKAVFGALVALGAVLIARYALV